MKPKKLLFIAFSLTIILMIVGGVFIGKNYANKVLLPLFLVSTYILCIFMTKIIIKIRYFILEMRFNN
jgi:cytochrome b subunit of formate dehydrogenase